MHASDRDWQAVLASEWRRSDDREYCDRLLQLLANRKVGPSATRLFVLAGTVLGAGLGTACACYAASGGMSGLAAVGIAGVLTALGALIGAWSAGPAQGVTWGRLLRRLLPQSALDRRTTRPDDPIVLLRSGLCLPLMVLACASPIAVLLALAGAGDLGAALAAVCCLWVGLAFFSPPARTQPFRWRRLAFWWSGRHTPYEVEMALRTACRRAPLDAGSWPERLARLDAAREADRPVEESVRDLASADWPTRWVAWHHLATSGRKAFDEMVHLARDPASPHQKTAAQIARLIAEDAASRTEGREKDLLCGKCFTRCADVSVEVEPGVRLPFHGCRSCGGGGRLFRWPGGVVTLLDSGGTDEPTDVHGELWVNWLVRAREKGFEGQDLYDSDRVEIVCASDDEVRHFLVDVTSDTDPARRKRYQTMECRIGPNCTLTENTLLALRKVFGRVTVP